MSEKTRNKTEIGLIIYAIYQTCNALLRMIVYNLLIKNYNDNAWQWSRIAAIVGYLWIIPYIFVIRTLKGLKLLENNRNYNLTIIFFSIACIFNLSEFSIVYLFLSVEFYHAMQICYLIARFLFGVLHIVYFIIIHKFMGFRRFFSLYLIILSFISYIMFPFLTLSDIFFDFVYIPLNFLLNIEIVSLWVFSVLYLAGSIVMIVRHYKKNGVSS